MNINFIKLFEKRKKVLILNLVTLNILKSLNERKTDIPYDCVGFNEPINNSKILPQIT